MMMRVLAALALIGLAIAMTAYFFIYAQEGDWLFAHKDWLGIVSSLITIATPIVILFGVILRKKKDKDEPTIQVNAGGDMVFGNQRKTVNHGTKSNHSKAE